MSHQLDIVTVNWNSDLLIRRLLDSFNKISDRKLIGKIIIVDNNSTDNSLDFIEQQKYDFNIQLIKNKHNLGFAKACNIGAKHADQKYLLFLNPDTIIYENSIRKCVEFLELDTTENYGACGIQLVNEFNIPNRSCARIPTFANFINAALGLNTLMPRQFPGILIREWNHGNTQDIGHVIGAFYMVRRNVFEKFAGFDERYFLYYEDLDFSTTLKNNNYKIAFLSQLRAVHIGGGCSHKIKSTRLSYSYLSKIKYIHKHFTPMQSFFLIFVILTIEPIMRFFFYLLQFSFKESIVSMLGYWQFVSTSILGLFRKKSYADR